MQILIDIDAPMPLYSQLIQQIKQAVLQKKIKTGDALPSIRQLANDLDVNNKTVAKAYRLLERDLVIQTKGYRGTFVHPEAFANCQTNLGDLATEKLQKTISALKSEGVTDSEIRIAFGNLMNNRIKQ
ncbi:GntR family transcriptional regulator [Flocculibacter collagenilyticus]|uniref:GntR family transcriptional regulator n=1 Tax=Flocculibacter collagenilyticus TaxID=2744479 RepID=UPI0018F611BA|nr:GntR family transcriptional regulator [Flocculibacter collagenilyticus]